MANPPPPPQPPADAVTALHIGTPIDSSSAPSSPGSPSDPLPAPTTPPAAQPKSYKFNSTPIRPSKNNLDIAQKVGRERRLGLVDDTGMGSRFHQLGIHTFDNALLPGSPPTASDRAKFFSPTIKNEGMSERGIGIELSKTIKSVLEAAGTGGLRVLHTPSHKAKGDHSKRSDTVNDIGIYVDTQAARRVTTLTSQDAMNSKLHKKELDTGAFGRRSWYDMAALGEIKSYDNEECAFLMMSDSEKTKRRKEKKATRDASEADTIHVDGGDSEGRPPPSTTDACENGIADTADDVEDEEGDVPVGPPIDVAEGKPYIRKGPKGECGLGQLGDYMHNLCAAQHRLFCYGFYVQWRWARLVYFDRTGALISEPFDWTTASSALHDFVWKFAHMTPEQRGYDATAQEASYAEMSEVFAAARSESVPKAVQPYIKKAFLSSDKPEDHSGTDGLEWDADEAPIYKLTVTSSPPSPDDVFPDSALSPRTADAADTSEHTFLVGRPHFVADSLVGRCTRGYMAWDISEKRFCFLKDSWRPLVPGRARPEHLVYEHLHSHGVRYIATLACGGDVGGPLHQPTVTHSYFPESKRPTPRVHYRIVIKEIGISLMEFADFGELNNVFMLALTAHYMAWNLAGVLHRDVSVGNILIDPITREAILIDWDLSRLRSELDNGPVELDRTGTWQFRSALSLAFPRKPYRLSDDIESFVHTYRWMVLRFHETEIQNLRKFVEHEYEENAKSGVPGIRVGGETKLSSFSSAASQIQVTGNPGLQGFLQDLAYKCFTHYQLIDLRCMKTLYGLPKYRTQGTTQPGSVSAVAPANVLQAVFGDGILDVEPAYVPAPVPGLSDPQPSTVTQPARDPCDVDGFLSKHQELVKLLYKWSGNTAPRQVDQFVLRYNDDPPDPVPNARSRDISSFSQSQTHDSTDHLPPRLQAAVCPSTLQRQSQRAAAESLPSSDASFVSFSSAPGRKRRQDDGEGGADDVGIAAPETDGVENGSCSTEVQVSKRQKKARTRV